MIPESTPISPGGPPLARYTLFKGPAGLRAGWRLLIFVAIVCAEFALTVAVLTLLRGPGRRSGTPSQLTTASLAGFELTILVCTAVASLIMARIEGRRFSDYGLPSSGAVGKNFWKGAGWGFLAINAVLLAIFALHGFRITGLALHGATIITATAAWTGTFVLVGISEEFSFRGYPLFTLASGVGFWPAALIISALFALAHGSNPGEKIAGLLSVVVFSLLFCLFLRRTGDLWFAIGFHAGFDWGQTFLYGVPDSGLLPYHSVLNSSFHGARWLTGGTVGPEASLFTPVVLLIAATIFSRRYKEIRYRHAGSAHDA